MLGLMLPLEGIKIARIAHKQGLLQKTMLGLERNGVYLWITCLCRAILVRYWATSEIRPPKTFPPWEQSVPILGRKYSLLGNMQLPSKTKWNDVRLFMIRRLKDHDTPFQWLWDGVSVIKGKKRTSTGNYAAATIRILHASTICCRRISSLRGSLINWFLIAICAIYSKR